MFEKKTRKKNINHTLAKQAVIFVLLLVLTGLLASPLAKKALKIRDVNKEISGLQSEADNLRHRNEDLRRLIDYLDSDEFINEQARKNLNLKREGESVLVIKDGSAAEPAAEMIYQIAGSQYQEKSEKNPSKWFKYFFH